MEKKKEKQKNIAYQTQGYTIHNIQCRAESSRTFKFKG